MSRERVLTILGVIISFISLYIFSQYNYLLFHSIVEIYSVCIAFTIFVIAWHSKRYMQNSYFMMIGIGYLFIGSLDLLHTLSYTGMPIFLDYDYYSTQFWIATRYLESITLLIAFLLIPRKKEFNKYVIFSVYTFMTTLIILSILYWKIFPVCFNPIIGQTDFKIMSEYIICIILLVALIVLIIIKKELEPKILLFMSLSVIFTILSELSFTLYTDVYGFTNLLGHYLKVISFSFIYSGVIITSIQQPYDLIFKALTSQQKLLYEQNKMLKEKVDYDGLTKLYTHRKIYDVLENLKKKYEQRKCTFSACLFDIDDFKKVNDEYGHVVGDYVLEEIAKLVQERIRECDFAGRYGGEEFFVILVDTNLGQCYDVVERLRLEIADYDFCKCQQITVSGGIAVYQGQRISDFVDACDKNLYKAKKMGKNRIES